MFVKKPGEFDRLQGEIQELFDELWQVPRFAGLRHGFRPQADCVRLDDPPELRVVVELPGVEPDDIQIYADDRTVLVTGERRRVCTGRYHQMEIDYGPFQRRIVLAERVDPSEARAEYRNGLLTIALPVAQREPAQERIVIQIAGRA